MLATLGGLLALFAGLAVLLLPLLIPELSRPRDATWGALVLLLGLVLVTSADRLTGSPMLAVLCGGLLIGRLSTEVGQSRWRALSDEERQRLGSAERWRTSLDQLLASLGRVASVVISATSGLGAWIRERRQPRTTGKRWVRPEPETALVEVASFTQIDELLIEAEAAAAAEPGPAAPPEPDQAMPPEAEPATEGELQLEVIDPEVIDAPAPASPPLGTAPLGDNGDASEDAADEGR